MSKKTHTLTIISETLEWKRFHRDILTWLRKTLEFQPYNVAYKQSLSKEDLVDNSITIFLDKNKSVSVYKGKILYSTFNDLDSMIPTLNRFCVLLSYNDGEVQILLDNKGNIPTTKTINASLKTFLKDKCVDMGKYEDIIVYSTYKCYNDADYSFYPENVVRLTSENNVSILDHSHVKSAIENQTTCIICSEIVDYMVQLCTNSHYICCECCNRIKETKNVCPLCNEIMVI